MHTKITQRKEIFLNELKKWCYNLKPMRSDLTQIKITGKNDSFIYNLRTTNHKNNINDLHEIWFDVSKNLLEKCDYVILLPVDSIGFYNIPVIKFKENIDIMFSNNSMQPSFTLLFSEERIIGLKNKGYIDLNGSYCLLLPHELTEFELNEPELPGFPAL